MSSTTARFACRCGAVTGAVAGAAPRAVNRVVCYCTDCQSFAHALQRPDVLDANGGSDVVQVAPGTITIEAGHANVAALRLTEKGLHRFHSTCCGTPLGNALGPATPIVGVVRQAFEVDGQSPDALFGPPVGAVHGAGAIGGAPQGSKGVRLSLLARMIGKIITWRLTGRATPNPFFDRATGRALFPVSVLPAERRTAIRAQIRAQRG
jgi:hypothetical protein